MDNPFPPFIANRPFGQFQASADEKDARPATIYNHIMNLLTLYGLHNSVGKFVLLGTQEIPRSDEIDPAIQLGIALQNRRLYRTQVGPRIQVLLSIYNLSTVSDTHLKVVHDIFRKEQFAWWSDGNADFRKSVFNTSVPLFIRISNAQLKLEYDMIKSRNAQSRNNSGNVQTRISHQQKRPFEDSIDSKLLLRQRYTFSSPWT